MTTVGERRERAEGVRESREGERVRDGEREREREREREKEKEREREKQRERESLPAGQFIHIRSRY